MYNITKTWKLHLKRKLKKKNSKRTGIGRASKEMFFATCFILSIAHTYKRYGEQIDGSILKEFS